MTGWIGAQRKLAARVPRKYLTLEDAFARMQEENRHLSAEQALHLTRHGVRQNEDGTYSWKFDPYVRIWPPYDMTRDAIADLWASITCPTLLVRGMESWATDPAADGRLSHFGNARVLAVENAGHWVHHDQLELFLREVRSFLDTQDTSRVRN
jgi:pimeloyl-ACP methyl ester carboxylesterase